MLQVRAVPAAVCMALGLSLPAAWGDSSTRSFNSAVAGVEAAGLQGAAEGVVTSMAAAGRPANAEASGEASRRAHARRLQAPGEQISNDAGRVRGGASLAGRIIRPDGTPADNARIAVYAVAQGTGTRTVVGTTRSAFDGRYEVLGLPSGDVIVGATPDSTSRRIETLYPGVDEPQRAGAITLFEGVATEGIDIWLTPSAQRFWVAGRVFGPPQRELRNIAIEYGGRTPARKSVWFVDDPGGVFTIEGVPQGTLLLLARAETDDGPVVGLTSTDVSVGNVEDLRIVLREPGHVEGRVVFERDAPNTNPLRISLIQTLLELSPLYPVEEATIGRDGRFALRQAVGENAFEITGLPEGWRVTRVSRGGRPLPNNRIRITPGERIDGVEVVLGRTDTK